MLRPRTLQEGSVGLFALLSLVVIGGIALWLRGGGFGQRHYEVFVMFEDASGLQVGGAVNFRGVTVGKVTQLIPSSNGVNAQLQIGSTDLRIPRRVQAEISRYGLLGEAAIELIPGQALSDEALTLDPLAPTCGDRQEILCNGDQLQGNAGNQLVSSMTRLSQAYSDPAFVANVNDTIKSASVAANRIAKMSDDIGTLAKTANRQVASISQTSQSITNAANNAAALTDNLNRLVALNQAQVNQTVQEAAQLMGSLNALVTENREQVRVTLHQIARTSEDIQRLSQDMDQAVITMNQGLTTLNPPQLAADVSTVVANAVATSENIRQITQDLNDPTLMLSLQKTLDAARVTLENAQKITSDVEEVTGDPTFRQNLRKLVDGLGKLVSSADQLQGQVTLAHTLDHSTQQLQGQLHQFYTLAQSLTVDPQASRFPQDGDPINRDASQWDSSR